MMKKPVQQYGHDLLDRILNEKEVLHMIVLYREGEEMAILGSVEKLHAAKLLTKAAYEMIEQHQADAEPTPNSHLK